MKTLARVTVILRRLSSRDRSFDAGRTAVESALCAAIKERCLTHGDVENLAALIAPDIEQMNEVELAANVRASLTALLVGFVTRRLRLRSAAIHSGKTASASLMPASNCLCANPQR